MKITFISNYLNHHQKFLANALNQHDFNFISTRRISDERKQLGYNDENNIDYLLSAYLSEDENERAKKRIMESDVLISGSSPEKYIVDFKKSGKILFRYTERPLKNGLEIHKYIPRLIKWHFQNMNGKNIYLLCASAYTYGDYKKFNLFKNHAYKWGYFPETKYYDIDTLIHRKSKNNILWCGRLLEWKKPKDAIELAIKLKEDGYVFKLKMIGTGQLKYDLIELINKNQLHDYVELVGAMTPENVRTQMENTGIFIFTSNNQEGWGAVLNEAMNSGCAVVASHLIGSVPFLIDHDDNGFVYESSNVDLLYKFVKFYLDHPDLQEKHGKRAYEKIINEWNAEVAAKRLYELSRFILAGEESPDLYQSGPCSKADVIKENWINYVE